MAVIIRIGRFCILAGVSLAVLAGCRSAKKQWHPQDPLFVINKPLKADPANAGINLEANRIPNPPPMPRSVLIARRRHANRPDGVTTTSLPTIKPASFGR